MGNAAMDQKLAIEVRKVSKRYKLGTRAIDLRGLLTGKKLDRPVVDAVKDVSFSVKKGEVLGLIGRNGSGKSTLIRMMAGIYRPTSGEIRIRGRTTALVELGAGFDYQLSGRENIFMNASGHGLHREEVEGKVVGIVEMAGIGRVIDFPIETYSSGMRARLGFSVAAALEPEVLLADEITAVGDTAFAEQCFAHFDQVRNNGTTVILASHNLNRLEAVADRIAWIDEGYLKMVGLPNDVAAGDRTFMSERRKNQ